MKKTLFSVVSFVALMTACQSADVVTPRPAGTAVTVPATTRETPIPSTNDVRDAEPATVPHQHGRPAEVPQPAGRDAGTNGSAAGVPATGAPAAGTPVAEVMPADTLARAYQAQNQR